MLSAAGTLNGVQFFGGRVTRAPLRPPMLLKATGLYLTKAIPEI